MSLPCDLPAIPPNKPTTLPPCPPACSPACAPSCPAACDAPACADGSLAAALDLQAGFLLWWTKSMPTPPLVSTGVLGAADTATLIGGRGISVNPVAGGTFAARFFVEDTIGIGLGGFFTETGVNHQRAAGFPTIAVPFLDPGPPVTEAALALAGPGAATGAAAVDVSSQLWGMEINGLYRLGSTREWSLDVLAGFRFLQLSEKFTLHTSTTLVAPGFFAGTATPAGSTYLGYDNFDTRNSFYGGQLGFRGQTEFGALSVQGTAQVALGSTRQNANANGSTTLINPGVPSSIAPGNVFTQRTNISRRGRDKFGVVPQVGVAMGYQLTDSARVLVGYDFLYWNSVARPGNQIDRQVNPALPPIVDVGGPLAGSNRPAPLIGGSDYWAQGLMLGLQVGF
jgi:hypothetical protein